MHYSPDFGEHLYNHYFKLYQVKPLISILLKSVPGVLSYSFVWNIIFCFFIILESVLLFSHEIKQPPSPVLIKWPHLGNKLHQSAWPELLIVSQIFVIMQITFLVLGASQ